MTEKKGYYTKEPSDHFKCSVCGAEPEDDDDIVNDDWETCTGRDMFFCPDHRVQYPCHNEECHANMCYEYHCVDNWMEAILAIIWDYDNEPYE